MKRIVLLLALMCAFMSDAAAQNAYEECSHEYIPQYFMDGAFVYAILLEDALDEFKTLDPLNYCVYNTYCMLAHLMVETKIIKGKSEETLTMVEENLGTENPIYGLALIPAAVYDDENLATLQKAADILKETAGDDSWEYALALYHCSNVTLDVEKYGSSEMSVEYARKCLEVLDGQEDQWLYRLAEVNLGAAMLLAQDSDGFDIVMKGYESLSENMDERKLFPFALASVTLCTLYTGLGYHDQCLELAEAWDPLLVEMELAESGIYMGLTRTMCYAYAMKGQRQNAREAYKKAEKACIARYGADSKQLESLKPYRQMF